MLEVGWGGVVVMLKLMRFDGGKGTRETGNQIAGRSIWYLIFFPVSPRSNEKKWNNIFFITKEVIEQKIKTFCF